MYSSAQLALKYLKYYASAFNGKGHGMHSPFVFNFITKVLNDKTHYPDYDVVEQLRCELLANHRPLSVTDLGAGSSTAKSSVRTISSIAKNAAKPARYGQLLYRMAKYYNCRNILELGTSLGITTSYLALANRSALVTTMEGAASVLSEAINNFTVLNIKNVKTVEGNFNDTLPGIIDEMKQIDLAFLDGNHRKEPTIRYFNSIVEKSGNSSIIILDDIHWSREMEEAWAAVKRHDRVTCSIDLFFIGILFFREEFYEKQDFAVRF